MTKVAGSLQTNMRTKFLAAISALVIKHPKRVISFALIFTLLMGLISIFFLQMNTDQDDLVSEKLTYHKRYKDYLREFGDLEYLYVVVEANGNIVRAKEFTKELSARLANLPSIKEVLYQVSNPKLEKSFLLYLPQEQISAIGEFLPKLQNIGDVGGVFRLMNNEIANLGTTKVEAADQKQLETGFRFLNSLVDGLKTSAQDNKPYTSFLQQAFFAGDRAYDEDGFLLSENGKLLFIMIMPEKNYKTLSVIEEPLNNIREVITTVKKDFPDVKAGLTGRPVLSADEMSVSNTDMTLATLASLLIVTLLFIAYFRRPTRPAMAAFALACGIVQTLGITTIFIGHLNILSVVFAVILVGAGIEFGLQIVSRYREELASHKNATRAIEVCIMHTGRGNITACGTTAVAFFSMCFTNFLALQELGFIAGIGIILCLLNMFTTLPAMIYLGDRNKHPDQLNTTIKVNMNAFAFLYNRPKQVLAVLLVLTIAGSFFLTKVSFNHNLLDMQAKGLESVYYEKKILEDSSQSTWFAPMITGTIEDSIQLAQRVKGLPSVGRVETIEEIVPADQDVKIALVKKINEKISSGNRPAVVELEPELQTFKKNLGKLTEMAFSNGETEAVEELEKVTKNTDELLQLLTGHTERIKNYETAFMADLTKHIEMLKGGLEPEKIELKDMPASIQRRFVSEKSGRISLYAYPKYDVWDPVKMDAYIKDLRSLDPEVTGTPVEVYESSRLLERSFRLAAILSAIAIFIVVTADFRKKRYIAFSVIPLLLGICWLLEAMGLFHIRFSLANFFGIPILLGIGIDNAVQIVHRYLREPTKEGVRFFMTSSMGTAVMLTSLTTFVTFATMIFARHQGIASLGLIMSVGTATCFVGSMILLPCLLILFSKK